MKRNVIWLIIGLVILALGGYQNVRYEEHSLLVTAVITDVKTEDDTDDGPTSYKHTYYGDYVVDGETYTDKKLDTSYTGSHIPDKHAGDTVEIRVYPDNPAVQVAEGALFIMVGLALTIFNGIKVHKFRKQQNDVNSIPKEEA